jgi:hypothetical protein
LDPDFSNVHWIDEKIRATRDGELFLFVNYPVIGIPGLFGVFFENNSGTAKVKITQRRQLGDDCTLRRGVRKANVMEHP